eukprot:3479529-Prymnesium_polylepis.1
MQGIHAWPMIAARWVAKTFFGRGFVSASEMFLAVGMYFRRDDLALDELADEEVAPVDVLRLGE